MIKKHDTQAFYLEAKKSLGQNFLKDNLVIRDIVENLDFLFKNSSVKFVHEIGPGSGAMTKPMLEKGFQILALEKDPRALEGLKNTLGLEFSKQLTLVEMDILKFSPEQITDGKKPICFGNIPFYITSDILFWFCKHKKFYTHGIFMVQNEVADRLQAKAGTKEYSRLSVKIQLNFHVEKLLKVPAASFIPKPKVDSAIVKLTPKEFTIDTPEDEKSFESFCAVLFSARRKMLRRVLHAHLQAFKEGQKMKFWKTAETFQIFEDTRPDAISPQSILELYYLLKAWNHK